MKRFIRRLMGLDDPQASLQRDLLARLNNSLPVLEEFLRKSQRNSDRDLQQILEQRQASHPNPLARFGRKCFSQTDEDGITLEIIRRLHIEQGSYAEFGVGNGLENNTLVLAALGWKGFWVGGEELAFSWQTSGHFTYMKEWITNENILQLFTRGCDALNIQKLDMLSLDLDGNDIYFVQRLLEFGCLPKVFIVEYNAKFIPPIRFQIEYDKDSKWNRDDYYGASLCSFQDLFSAHGYTLVCCNAASGANAFFVRNEFMEHFPDVPNDVGDIYSPPHFHLYGQYGHKASARVVERVFNR